MMDRFDGSVLVNQRLITSAARHFRRRREGKSSTDASMSFFELADILYLIDLYVVCPSIRIDGSVPHKDKETFNEELVLLKEFGIDTEVFSFSTTDDEAIKPSMFQISALQASASIRQHQDKNYLDQALPSSDAARMVAEVEKALKNLASVRRTIKEQELSAELAVDLAAQNFRGSKALSGFTALGHDSLEMIAGFISNSPDPDLACASLINRFRFFYLRQIAFNNLAVYSPGQRWESLSNQQHLHLADYARQRLGVRMASSNDTAHEEAILPPIALYALLSYESKGSRPLLERVAALRNEFSSLRGFFTKTTVQASQHLEIDPRDSNNIAIDEGAIQEVEAYFEHVFRDIDHKRQYGHGMHPITRYTVPALAGLGATYALYPVVGPISYLATPVIGTIITDFLKDSAQNALSGILTGLGTSTVDQYRKLHSGIFTDPVVSRRLASVISQEFRCAVDFNSVSL